MGVLGVLGTLGSLDLEQINTSNNFEQLPDVFKEYGKSILSICYNPIELREKGKNLGMINGLTEIFEDQIKKEKNYSNRLEGSVQLLGLMYCSFFEPKEIKTDINHEKNLKALQGLELETLVIDQAIDNPEKYNDLDLRSTNSRILYSIVTTDFYETVENSKLSNDKKFKIIKGWNNLLGDIYVGQSIDLIYTGIGPISEKDYLHMIGKTTANFVKYSAELGATYAMLNEEQTVAAEELGFNLGIAFQIRDDWEDFQKDIEEGKSRAFMTKEALTWLPENYRKFVTENHSRRKEEIIEIIKDSGIPVYVKDLNNEHVEKAKELISGIHDFSIKNRLEELTNIIKI
ncbi:polyprenyl synthetase family protein [Candidatus Woesearchaeota archaeon]|nr:polyprenyl synthetase family protein [Candidatus Woesearchaeota archaeon]